MKYELSALIELISDIEDIECSLKTKEAKDLMESFWGYIYNAEEDLCCLRREEIKSSNTLDEG